MNSEMAPRDRGHRDGNPGWQSRSGRTVSRALGLERGTASARKGDVTDAAP